MASLQEIAAWKAQYTDIYSTVILGIEYIWRPITKKEYADIDISDITDEEKEDLACQLCVLTPSIDYEDGPAGIPNTLITEILAASGFVAENADALLAEYRAEMSTLEAQMEAIVAEAFPMLTLDEIESWDVPKTLKYYSRAEWILSVLRGVPISEILQDINNPQDGLVQGDASDFRDLM